jgi:hypothetical protein
MAAPEGNQFWKTRSKHGRDKLFSSPELLWEAACEYFLWCDENPLLEEKAFHYQGFITKSSVTKMRAYTLTGLCIFLGCNDAYFRQFTMDEDENAKKSDDEEDFSTVITRIRDTIYTQKFVGAAADLLNANIIARDLGLRDAKDVKMDLDLSEMTDEQKDKEIAKLKALMDEQDEQDGVDD